MTTIVTDKSYRFKHTRWGEFSGRVLEKHGDNITVQITAGTVSFVGGSLRGPGRRVTMHVVNIEAAEEV